MTETTTYLDDLGSRTCCYPGCREDRADAGQVDSRPRPFCVRHERQFDEHVKADQHGWGIPT